MGRAGQVSTMQAEAVAEAVDQAADGEFWRGVLAANAGHPLGALSRFENVGSRSSRHAYP